MPQRFYPYHPAAGDAVQCEVANCTNTAYWWDADGDAILCDFHAMAKASPVRVQCEVCALLYPPSQVCNGVCVDCRSVMPLLWTKNEVCL